MIILGLGSNLGDREAHLRKAAACLAEMLGSLNISRVLESPALLPPKAPPEWDKPFLNLVATAKSHMEPQALLNSVKQLERELGRQQRGVWAPREIDIDILAVDEEVIQSPDLIVPHPKLLSRDFALLPMTDVAPNWRYPLKGEYCGKTAAALAKALGYELNKNLRDSGIKIYA